MKIALLGNGKTGSKIQIIAKYPVTVFNSTNVPTLEKLRQHDVVISFLPGHIFLEYFDLLVESKIPVITGSTGFEWTPIQKKLLTEQKLKWVCATNFSLGMNIVKNMIHELSLSCELFDEYDFNIHEVHHTKKLDAPSGTAKSWKSWLEELGQTKLHKDNKQVNMTYDRVGDVIGFHEITLTTPDEEIKLSHTAKDRSLFARGALWAAEKVINNINFPVGLTQFSQLVQENINELLNDRRKK